MAAADRGLQGSVLLRCKVLANGRCSEITVERASAPESLQHNAIKALARWRFETEVVAGVAVEPWVLVPFCFTPSIAGAPRTECKTDEARAITGSEPAQLKLCTPIAQR
ncbi:MAG: energy transducer TonB [Rhodanobacteraceae bacterium]|nr:energy transducer TonB [Rhodanobacteraceae bacterium]